MQITDKVGRNDPCPCGNGKKYKNCHERIDAYYQSLPSLPKSSKVNSYDSYIGVYASFDYLYPPEPNSRTILSDEISKYDLDDFLQTAAKLNFLCGGGYGFVGDKDLAVLKTMGQDEVYKRACDLKKSGIVKQVIVHHQIIALMIENLLLSKSTQNIPISDSILKDLKKCLFRINDFLENDLYDPQIKEMTDIEITVGSLFRNMYLNSGVSFEHLMGRYYAIFFRYFPKTKKKYPREHYDFLKSFKEKKGIDLKIYMVVAFQLWGYFSKNNLQEKTEFLKNPGNFILSRDLKKYKSRYKEEAERAFEVFAKDRAWFRDAFQSSVQGDKFNYYRIDPLLASPIYKLPNGNYFPLDLKLLEHKLTTGVMWDIHDHIKDELNATTSSDRKATLEKERQLLRAFYGRPIELYVKDILKAIAKHQGSTVIIDDEKETGGVDFVIYDSKRPDSLVMIELTTSWITYATAMSGNTQNILDEFTKKFVIKGKNKSQKAKIKQLHDSIEFFNSKTNSPDLKNIKGKVKKIYPILMTETGFPQFPGFTERYIKIISDNKLLGGYLDNFQFLDLGELELIEPLIGSGEHDFRLTDLFENRIRSPRDLSQWSFRNYLHMKKLIKTNPRMFELFKGILYDADKIIKVSFKERLQIINQAVRRNISHTFKKLTRN